MSLVEKKYEDLKLKYEYNNNAFKEKQQILAEYEKMIEEAKNAYKKVMSFAIFFFNFESSWSIALTNSIRQYRMKPIHLSKKLKKKKHFLLPNPSKKIQVTA